MFCKVRCTASQAPAQGRNALTAWMIDQGESPVQETHFHFSHSAGKVKQKVEPLSLIIMLFCIFCYRFLRGNVYSVNVSPHLNGSAWQFLLRSPT